MVDATIPGTTSKQAESSKNHIPLQRVMIKPKDWKQGANPFKQNRYGLQSYKSRAAQNFLAQHLYNIQNTIYVYDNNGP